MEIGIKNQVARINRRDDHDDDNNRLTKENIKYKANTIHIASIDLFDSSSMSSFSTLSSPTYNLCGIIWIFLFLSLSHSFPLALLLEFIIVIRFHNRRIEKKAKQRLHFIIPDSINPFCKVVAIYLVVCQLTYEYWLLHASTALLAANHTFSHHTRALALTFHCDAKTTKEKKLQWNSLFYIAIWLSLLLFFSVCANLYIRRNVCV